MNGEQEPFSPEHNLESEILETAKNLALAYWQRRLAGNNDVIERTKKDLSLADSYQGLDFDIARCHAYIRMIEGGRFFDQVGIVWTYEGQPASSTEKSPYEFFKGIIDSIEIQQKHFGDNEGLMSQFRETAAEAKMIVNAIEQTKDFSNYAKSKTFKQN